MKNNTLPLNSEFYQYRVLQHKGRGMTGDTYRVEHSELGKRFSLKVFDEGLSGDKDVVQRVRAEVKLLANMKHPHIVKLDGLGKTEDKLWLRNEWVAGREVVQASTGTCSNLKQLIEAIQQPLPLREVVRVLRSLLQALDYAHQSGALHLNLKPSNVLLTADSIKIADFELRKFIGSEWHQWRIQECIESSVFGSTAAKATPGMDSIRESIMFMAPELQARAEGSLACDIYSVGMLANYLFTGHLVPGLYPPSQIHPDLAKGWDVWIQSMTHMEPAQRPNSAADALKMMEAIKNEEAKEIPQKGEADAPFKTFENRKPKTEAKPEPKPKAGTPNQPSSTSIPSHEKVSKLERKEKFDQARGRFIRGLIFAIGGGIFTAISYSNASSGGGTYTIATGAILWGVIDIIAGLVGMAANG